MGHSLEVTCLSDRLSLFRIGLLSSQLEKRPGIPQEASLTCFILSPSLITLSSHSFKGPLSAAGWGGLMCEFGCTITFFFLWPWQHWLPSPFGLSLVIPMVHCRQRKHPYLRLFICQTNGRELSITVWPIRGVQTHSRLQFSMDRTVRVCVFCSSEGFKCTTVISL